MLKRLLFPAAAVLAFALAAPAFAQGKADVPLDPACPSTDADLPHGANWICIGRLTADYAFAFIFPAAAVRYPPLDPLLREQASAAEARLAASAASARAGGSIPFTYQAVWRFDTILPEIVAASGSIATFEGGAHGGIEYRTILIDPRERRTIALADLFHAETFDTGLFGRRIRGMRAVQASFCRALTAAVRERQQDPTAAVTCPAIEAQPVTLVCGARGRIETMRALLDPYVIGPWAAGSYEVDFPVDAEMIGTMTRRYRVAFGLPGETRRRPRTC